MSKIGSRVLELLERFVVAHERSAEATERIAAAQESSHAYLRANVAASERIASAQESSVKANRLPSPLEWPDLSTLTASISSLSSTLSVLLQLWAPTEVAPSPNESEVKP